MNRTKIVSAGALLLSLNAAGALAAVPERATATIYVAPAVSAPQISLKGNSRTMPAILNGYVHPAEQHNADSWYWDEQTIFAARTLAYGGWCQGRLINALHFFINGNQLTFARQYVVHYGRTAAGDDLTAIECYRASGNGGEEFAGQTQYLSSLAGGKLYLKSVDHTGPGGFGHKHLDIAWTPTGVNATLTQERGTPEDFVLQANKTWLKQNFDLWNDFGLKFQ